MKLKKVKNLRHAEYYGMVEQFDELYKNSLNGKKFNKLMSIITSENNIMLAYRNIKINSGSVTPGIDKVTIKDIESIEHKKFIDVIQRKFKNYNPKSVKRVDIPKPNGKMRPLGIPSMWDRIIQQCILQVLDPICEAKFNKHSYGFRPNRSTENALADVLFRVNQQQLQYIIDIDIESFFDNVNHNKLSKQIWNLGVRDKQLLKIINKILKAPIVLTNGNRYLPEKGTPQGGILSPLLSNIVLNEFDWWISNQWETFETKKKYADQVNSNGQIGHGLTYRMLRKNSKLKEMYIVRYADDFKILTNSRENADKIYRAIEDWLKTRLKLNISSEKSKITNLKKENSEFLGFSIRLVPKGNKFVAQTHVSKKALDKVKSELVNQIKTIQKAPEGIKKIESVYRYNSMIIGVHNYYRFATHVTNDFHDINYQITKVMYNRLANDGLTQKGQYDGKDRGILRYIQSNQMRYVCKNKPLLPLGYVQHKNPMNKKHSINKYTSEGRLLIHKDQKAVEEWKLKYLREHPIVRNRGTIEFNDNRIGKFLAQKGICAITGEELILSEMDCHHIVPWEYTKDDSYKNLVLIEKNAHKLVHATTTETINYYFSLLNLDTEKLKKLNDLRDKVGNNKLTIS